MTCPTCEMQEAVDCAVRQHGTSSLVTTLGDVVLRIRSMDYATLLSIVTTEAHTDINKKVRCWAREELTIRRIQERLLEDPFRARMCDVWVAEVAKFQYGHNDPLFGGQRICWRLSAPCKYEDLEPGSCSDNARARAAEMLNSSGGLR